MNSTRMLRPLAAAAFAAGLLAGSPAMASPNTASVVGTGTISPGLPTSGCANQTVSFDGTAVVAGDHAGTYSVHFDGTSSICETLSTGAGGGTLSGGVAGNVTYSRTGSVVTLSGNVEAGGSGPHVIVGGACKFAPTSANPVNSYALTCHLVIQ